MVSKLSPVAERCRRSYSDCNRPVTHPWMSIQFFARDGDNMLTTLLDCLREAGLQDRSTERPT